MLVLRTGIISPDLKFFNMNLGLYNIFFNVLVRSEILLSEGLIFLFGVSILHSQIGF